MRHLRGVLFLALLCMPSLSLAQTVFDASDPSNILIFSNFGTSLGQGGWVVSGTQNDSTLWAGEDIQTAESFTMSNASLYLSQISTAVQISSGSNAFLLTLNQNSNGMPGQVLEQWVLTNVAPFGGGNPTFSGFETVYPTGNLLLQGGKTYWLVVSPLNPNSTTNGAWHDSSASIGTVDQQVNGGAWQTYTGYQGTFSVDGTVSPVPEPGTFLLLGTGLLALGPTIIKRKFRR